jgi:hypothetical protein
MAVPRSRRQGAGHYRVLSRRTAWAAAALLVSASGCAPADRGQLAKDVLARDPSFAAVLEKRQTLLGRIQTFQKELTLKRSTVEKTIGQLRKDLAAATANVRLKTAEAKQRMEPDRQRLEAALLTAGQEVQGRRQQRAAIGREIVRFKKTAKQFQTTWSPEQIRQHEAQLAELLQDAARLDGELTVLKEHIRLLKVKLLLIKL